MQSKRTPDPRFEKFEEQFNAEGKPIGFKLPDCEFLFEYDSNGGWTDEKGNYFNSDGVLEVDDVQPKEEEEEQEEIGDDEILDQFEQILLEEEEGIVKKKIDKSQKMEASHKQEKFKDYRDLIEKITKKEDVRDGMPQKFSIYFKMRSKFYQRIVPEIQKKQSVNDKNECVKQILLKIQKTKESLLASNPWLTPTSFLSFSGATLDSSIYDRYWYGYLLVDLQQYLPSLQKIEKSKQFALLDDKNYYALKSRLYAKKKMINTVKEMREKVQAFEEGKLVKISLNNLPIDFPLSFVYDLADLCGANATQIEQASIIDESSALIMCSKAAALKFTKQFNFQFSIEGYVHDSSEFIWLEQETTAQPVHPKPQFINIGTSSKFKLHQCQLHDTLALSSSRQEVAKHFTQQQSKQTQFQMIVGSQQALRKILMWRGESLDVNRIKFKE